MNTIHMRKSIIALLIAAGMLTGISVASAQTQVKTEEKQTTSQTKKVGKLELHGKIFDRRTTKEAPYATIAILRSDSSLVAGAEGHKITGRYDRATGMYSIDTLSDYSVQIPRIPDEYIIRVTLDGYEPYFNRLSLTNLGSREIKRELPNIFLTPEKTARTLDEVTVSATKIKFYNKGDTIVYNADAFMLPEGSSLDALIAQMPGVEMKDGGKIYVNGKYVESLLLNGKDFFKGNQEVMLQNVGAYAVKDIKVYEKLGNLSELAGQRVDNDSEYVMDVRLKKDYLTGWMLNAEAGYALPDNHYLGKVFAMMENTNTTLSVYGNVNDLSDTRRPSDGRGYQYRQIKSGVTSVANGGVNYNVTDSRKTVSMSGNVDVNYSDTHSTVDQYITNFLSGGDTYGNSFADQRQMNLSVATSHELNIKKQHWNLKINPAFSYNHSIDNETTDEITLSENVVGMTRGMLNSIYSGDFETVRQKVLNRNRLDNRTRGHGIESSLRAELNLKPSGMSDAISVLTEATYDRSSSFLLSTQALDLGAVPAISKMMENYEPTRPKYQFMWRGALRYYFYTPYGRVKLAYEYRHQQNRQQLDIFTREAEAENALAQLTPDIEQIPDFNNSYNSMLYRNTHLLQTSWNYEHSVGKNKWQFSIAPTIGLQNRHLFYERGENYFDLHRTSFIASNAMAEIHYTMGDKGTISGNYTLNTTTADLLDMVDIVNDSDPLNIQEGNPDLKDSWRHALNVYANYRFSTAAGLFGSVYFTQTDRDIVKGYTYQSATGIRTFKSYNVDGSRRFTGNLQVAGQFGRGDCLNYNGGVFVGLSGYSAMIGEDAPPVEQHVNNNYYGGSVGFGYNNKSFCVGGYFYGQATRTGSVLSGFEPFTYYDYAPYFEFKLNEIKGFSFSTNFGISFRRGYADPALNTTQYQLNAEASYTLPGGRWMFKLTGYDLLNQNKIQFNNVTAASSITSVYNTMRRYAMLSVTYRFHSSKR